MEPQTIYWYKASCLPSLLSLLCKTEWWEKLIDYDAWFVQYFPQLSVNWDWNDKVLSCDLVSVNFGRLRWQQGLLIILAGMLVSNRDGAPRLQINKVTKYTSVSPPSGPSSGSGSDIIVGFWLFEDSGEICLTKYQGNFVSKDWKKRIFSLGVKLSFRNWWVSKLNLNKLSFSQNSVENLQN